MSSQPQRSNVFARLAFVLSLAMMLAAPSMAEERDPYEYFFQPTFGDFQEELETARADGKTAIMVFFQMDECPFCHRMKENILNQREVQDFFQEHFSSFSVDVEGAIEINDFQGNTTTEREWAFEGNRVRATPVFQFYNLEGEPIARLTGATSTPEEFIWLGEYVVSGAYKEQPFSRYRRERQQAARDL